MAPTYVMDVPEGAVRTAVNPPTSSDGVIPAGAVTTTLAILAVCLRLFTRRYVVKGVFGVDDYLCISGLFFGMGYLGVSLNLLRHGAGHHMWDVLKEIYNPAFWQTEIGAMLIYAASISSSKLSILSFYLRISPDKRFRRVVFGLIAIVCAYTVVYIFLVVFRCQPIAANWDMDVSGKCIDSVVPMMTLNIANIVIDVVILVLPIRVIVPLQIPISQKVSLLLLFATGGIVCAATIKRTIIMSQLLRHKDFTWEISQQVIWGYIEVNAGLVCACVPALKPLVMKYIPFIINTKLRHSGGDSSKSRSNHSHALEKAKRSHRGPYSHSYELPSRDQSSEGARRDDDDEARLWSKDGGDKNALQKLETQSFDSMSDSLPAKPAPVAHTAELTTKRKQDVLGMHITKEICIKYGPISELEKTVRE